ncbi:tetratricopeptide repeat protein 12 isoform X1 [Ictalurus punctatus]|uniref:Tetratricopeptide repeat protein 12 isoform X1 n=2 Tax=Ictalurus punctatus TaxID=7998 RepID=A0A2D0ST68_ICTPU|nr:tetratricopeptide repeat protein 12 isoform X1 [Ictalurus punctatus]
MDSCESEDLEKFLTNVDRISELVKELNSADVAAQEKAMEKADCLVASMEKENASKSHIDRTVINPNPSCMSRPVVNKVNATYVPSESPENFMRSLEKDVEERRMRRQVKEKQANALKEKGNKAFALGDYELAVKMYTEGLEQLRDMPALYTNRAQAHIKLEKYKEAISDCEWALKCNHMCIKAYVHMGRAHLGLKNFIESRLCYGKILDIAPERETLVKDYLTRVDLEEKKSLQEQTALKELNDGKEGAVAIPEFLTKLDRPNEHTLYYCGGVELLTQAVKDSTGQTLFRLNNGFSVIAGNKNIKSCLAQTSKELHSEELCVSVLRLWRMVCSGNEENQQLLLHCPSTREQIVQLLTSTSLAVQQECLTLICMYCQTQHGRRLVIENLNLLRMVELLMDCVCKEDKSGTMALAILENLAGENKFRIQSRESITKVFAPPFEHLLENVAGSSQDLLPCLISVIGAMSVDEVIINRLASREEFWKSLFSAMGWCASCEYRNALYPLLGLMINIASNQTPIIQAYAVVGCKRCVDLLSDPDGGIITRAAGLLSVVLPKSAALTQEIVQQGVVKKLLRILKGEGHTSSRYSIKALAVCTASGQQACQELVKLDMRLVTIRKLLGSSDELVVGNAALCLGHCLAVQGAAASLLGTDCVMLLLRHVAGKTNRADVQQNAAITLGKLCRAEPRHMVKLRELNGLEILHSCMKLIT